MSKIIEDARKGDFIKDNMIKVIKGSEAVAVQAMDSTKTILKAGLSGAEELGAQAGDLMLNAARRAINAGNIIGGDLFEATRNMVKGTVQAASEIGSEIKGPKTSSGKSEEKAKQE